MSTNNRDSAIREAVEKLSDAYRLALRAHRYSESIPEQAQTSDAIDAIALAIEGLGGEHPILD